MPIKLFVNSVKHIHFHWHKEIEIIYVLQGSVVMYMDQRQYRLHQDDIIVVNSMSVHKIERTSEDNVLLTLQFGPEWLDANAFIHCNSSTQTEENRSSYDAIRHNLAKMVYEINKKASGFRSYTLGSLQMLCGYLLRYFFSGSNEAAEEDTKSYDYKRLNRVLQYVDQHYKEKLTLQTMADQEHLSLHYFSHFFSDKIGIPFQKYLTLVRLEKAQAELATTTKSITEIALDCGFANVKLFNKYFKEKYNRTPSAYRETFASTDQPDPDRKPLTYEESSSGDYYETDTIQAMASLYRYLYIHTDEGTEFMPTFPVPGALSAVASTTVNVMVQANEQGKPLDKHWNVVTTAGRAVEGLREDWQCHFSGMQRRFPFQYIRFHGIFNDEMMVYSEAADGTPIYNWSYVDKLYDYLLQVGIRPFVELGFMPSLLRRSNETVFWWKGSISPPKEQSKWDALVQAFVRHCLNRYGWAEVSRWYFEVWNEPDLSGVCWAGTKEEYFAFYASTVQAIKSVSPELKVGGPALGYGSLWNDTWAEEFLAYCSDHQVPLDFFSFHVYSEYPFLKEEADSLTTIMPPSFFRESIERMKAKLSETPYRDVELFMTEWNFSLYDRNLIHDTMFMAPFVIYHALTTLGSMKGLAFWCFTDIFEESIVPPSHFYGGFGLINRDGLKKPSYYAFQLLHKLGDQVIACGDGYFATRRCDGSLQLLLYHYVHVDQLFASGDWTELSDMNRYAVFEEKGNKGFHIHLKGLAGSYKMTSYLLTRELGSVFDEWIRMGAPEFLTEEELRYLEARSGPTIKTQMIHDVLTWQQEVTLPPHGVQLFTFERQY
ncbi:GH39 family glycosyl hydrolase [Paenibacillus alvei]|uniref:GH39 family glycosyl hydrolase n=1 Tax=Paenibacillus alvei TaxID=44250 RepID=UPI0039902C6E